MKQELNSRRKRGKQRRFNKALHLDPELWITITHTVLCFMHLFKKENLSSSDNILDICTLTADTHIISVGHVTLKK